MRSVKAHPFEAPRLARLSRLEAVLPRSSEGAITLNKYSGLLRAAGLWLPIERTLYEDITRYAQFCDDLVYGKRAKTLEIDPTASRDAVAWMPPLCSSASVESPEVTGAAKYT